MADQKISELTALTGANVADDDAIAIVDTSATETKKIVFSELKNALDTATGFVRITGDTMTGDLALSGADVTFGDNDKAIFGAGSDLQIYHDGSHSYISDQGTGRLKIFATDLEINNAGNTANYIQAFDGGAVQLFYNNSQKLATTSTGVDITGTLTSDAAGFYQSSGTSQLRVGADDAYNWNISRDNVSTGGLQIQSKDAAADVTRAFFALNGDISFYEDTGTTAKFFWDASAESLGIGTSSPSAKLDVSGAIRSTDRISADGTEAAPAFRFTTDSNTGMFPPSGGDAIGFSTGGSERMRIDSSGNVGIGTNSPNDKLTVSGSAAYMTIDRNDGEAGVTFRYNGDNTKRADIATQTNGDLRFRTNLAEAMRIDSSGNVGIGTSSPQGAAHIKGETTTLGVDDYPQLTIETAATSGAANTGGGILFLNHDGTGGSFGGSIQSLKENGTSGNSAYYMRFSTRAAGGSVTERMRIDSSGNLLVGTTSSNSTGIIQGRHNNGASNAVLTTWNEAGSGTRIHMQFLDSAGGSDRGSITTNGSSTSFNTTSDYRLKENVVELTGATTRLKQLEPKRFNFIADADTTVDGFLAHEVQSIVPEAITGTHNEVDAEGNPVYQGIDQSKLVPLLVATIQELEARITALENA